MNTIKSEGSQESILPNMMTREDLYRLIRYKDYSEFDKNIYNF
ncbi:MAG: hypothetical protein OEZ36_07510 [Spirochaetota bacterium]|nr:hypothetical protein [Spirochaetota bacterium]